MKIKNKTGACSVCNLRIETLEDVLIKIERLLEANDSELCDRCCRKIKSALLFENAPHN